MDRLDLCQCVRVVKPLAQDVVDDRAGPGGLPGAAWRETAKVDRGMQQTVDGLEILLAKRLAKADPGVLVSEA